MTDTITIPPEAVEAVAIELYYDAYGLSIAWQDAPAWKRDDFRRKATAAIRAALAAWPGVRLENLCGWVMDGPDLPYVEETASIILPLPQQENSDDQ